MKAKFPFLALPLLTVFVCLLLNNSPLSRAVAQTKPVSEAQGRQLRRGDEIKALPGKSKRWALVIGVDDYSESQISKLSGAANDARALADALVRDAGFPKDQVTLLASDQPSGLQPRRSTILRYLSNLRGLVPKDGLLLLSFAGHGIERGGRAFLLPSDALGLNDMALLEDTAIGVDRIKESIRATGVGQVILILDACRSDPAPGRSGGGNLMTADFRKSFNFDVRNREVQAFVTLYATAVGHRAYEYAAKRQGYFTWALIQGLRGEAVNEKGEVTLANLVRYVQETVPKFVLRDLGGGNQQRPFAIVEGYRADELVIALASKTAGEVSSALTTQPRATAAQPIPAEPLSSNGSDSSSISGKYIHTKNAASYLELKPDGTFFLSQVFSGRVFQNTGKYEGDDKQITLKLDTGMAARGTIEKNKISFEDGSVYVHGSAEPALASSPANPGVSISLANLTYIRPNFPVGLRIGGAGWDGGSDIKVMVNGQDVSSKIRNQGPHIISLQGSIAELNLQDGKNEVFVIVNTVTSNTSVFKLFRQDASSPSVAKPSAMGSGVTISHAGYTSRYDSRNNKTSSSLGVFFKGRESTRQVVKVIVNGRDLSQRIAAAQAPGYVSLSGSIGELNLHDGENEVAIIVNGVSSNIYKFQVNQKLAFPPRT